MAPRESLLSGFVACVVATAVASAVGGKRLGMRIGFVTGAAVALSTWVFTRRDTAETERTDEATAV